MRANTAPPGMPLGASAALWVDVHTDLADIQAWLDALPGNPWPMSAVYLPVPHDAQLPLKQLRVEGDRVFVDHLAPEWIATTGPAPVTIDAWRTVRGQALRAADFHLTATLVITDETLAEHGIAPCTTEAHAGALRGIRIAPLGITVQLSDADFVRYNRRAAGDLWQLDVRPAEDQLLFVRHNVPYLAEGMMHPEQVHRRIDRMHRALGRFAAGERVTEDAWQIQADEINLTDHEPPYAYRWHSGIEPAAGLGPVDPARACEWQDWVCTYVAEYWLAWPEGDGATAQHLCPRHHAMMVEDQLRAFAASEGLAAAAPQDVAAEVRASLAGWGRLAHD